MSRGPSLQRAAASHSSPVICLLHAPQQDSSGQPSQYCAGGSRAAPGITFWMLALASGHLGAALYLHFSTTQGWVARGIRQPYSEAARVQLPKSRGTELAETSATMLRSNDIETLS